jgi:hypothetical protein
MTGSETAAFVIPAVALPILLIWLAVIFHADRHPFWRTTTQNRPEIRTELPRDIPPQASPPPPATPVAGPPRQAQRQFSEQAGPPAHRS